MLFRSKARNSIVDSLENLSNFCMLFFKIRFYAIYNIKRKAKSEEVPDMVYLERQQKYEKVRGI